MAFVLPHLLAYLVHLLENCVGLGDLFLGFGLLYPSRIKSQLVEANANPFFAREFLCAILFLAHEQLSDRSRTHPTIQAVCLKRWVGATLILHDIAYVIEQVRQPRFDRFTTRGSLIGVNQLTSERQDVELPGTRLLFSRFNMVDDGTEDPIKAAWQRQNQGGDEV